MDNLLVLSGYVYWNECTSCCVVARDALMMMKWLAETLLGQFLPYHLMLE